MTQPPTTDHESNEAIELATQWLSATPLEKRPAATMSLLREMFGLTNLQAVDVIRAALARRMGGAHGASS